MKLNNTIKLLFAGERVEDITMIIMHYLAMKKKVLVLDLTSEKKIIINTTGLLENNTCSWNRIQYTSEYQYYCEHEGNYDVILIGTECLTNAREIVKDVNSIYILSSLRRYSLLTFMKNMDVLDTIEFPDYFFVFRAEKRELTGRGVEEFWKLRKNRKSPHQCYYIPDDFLDSQALKEVEYEDFDRIKLSYPMQKLAEDISNRLYENEINTTK